MAHDTYPDAYPDVHSSSNEYAARFSSPVGQWMLSIQDNLLLDAVRRSNAKTVFDVGGGHGQVAKPLVNNNYDCTVQGSTAECGLQILDLLRAGKVKFVVGDMFKLPAGDNAYDAVTCFRILSHVDNWQGLIAELCRVSSSTVIIDYPTLISFNILSPILFQIKKRIEGNTRTFSVFTKRQIVNEFKKHGFELVSHRGQFFWPMGIHRLLNNPVVANALEGVSGVVGLNKLFGTPVVAAFSQKRALRPARNLP